MPSSVFDVIMILAIVALVLSYFKLYRKYYR
jgi:hypothetical protein